MKNWISDHGIETISCAIIIYAMASCEYKETQAREETKQLQLQLEHIREMNDIKYE